MISCDQCGFVYASVTAADIPGRLRAIGSSVRAVLPLSDEKLMRTRPTPDVWSALEYTCHLRDVLLTQRERLYLALVEDTPTFVSMYRDDRVRLARYAEQAPTLVAHQLEFASGLVADAFAALDVAQWQRTCVYGYPEPATHTLEWVGQHTIHEGVHHLGDIRDVLRRLHH